MKDLQDPWGRRYVMLCGPTLPKTARGSSQVISVGPDGQQGTEDDIKSSHY